MHAHSQGRPPIDDGVIQLAIGRVADFTKRHLAEIDISTLTAGPKLTREDFIKELRDNPKIKPSPESLEAMKEKLNLNKHKFMDADPESDDPLDEGEPVTVEQIHAKLDNIRRIARMTDEEFLQEMVNDTRAALDELEDIRRQGASGELDAATCLALELSSVHAISKQIKDLKCEKVSEEVHKKIALVAQEHAQKMTEFKAVPFPAETPVPIKMMYEMMWPMILDQYKPDSLRLGTKDEVIPKATLDVIDKYMTDENIKKIKPLPDHMKKTLPKFPQDKIDAFKSAWKDIEPLMAANVKDSEVPVDKMYAVYQAITNLAVSSIPPKQEFEKDEPLESQISKHYNSKNN
jgi:hypothetical protein